MKKILFFMALLCAWLSIHTVTTFAEETVRANFLSDGGLLEIDGKIGEAYGTLVLVVITDTEKALIDIEGDNTLVQTVYTKDDGLIDTDFRMPDDLQNGKYYVYLFTKNAEAQTDFMYISEKNMQELIAPVNEAENAEEVYLLISGPENSFAIDMETLEPYLMEIAKAFYEMKSNKTYTDAKTLIKDLKTAEAVGQLRAGVPGVEVLQVYGSYFGMEYDKYAAFSDAIRGEIDSQLTDGDYSVTTAEELYLSAQIYAEIRHASSWYTMKEAVMQYDEYLELDKQYFDLVVNKDDVYSQMYRERSAMKDIDAVKTVFYTVSEAVYQSENRSSGDSTGSSGGRGPGGGGIGGTQMSVSTEIINEINNSVDIQEQEQEQEPELTDIAGHWAERYIQALCEEGIVSGFTDHTFRPDNAVTRAEFIKMTVEAFRFSGGSGSVFYDVSPEAWYAVYVAAAYENGLVTGDENGAFHPEEPITRQDAATIIYRALQDDITVEVSDTSAFFDFEDIADYARNPVAALNAEGIMEGMADGRFAPLENTARAEVAAILYRIIYK